MYKWKIPRTDTFINFFVDLLFAVYFIRQANSEDDGSNKKSFLSEHFHILAVSFYPSQQVKTKNNTRKFPAAKYLVNL